MRWLWTLLAIYFGIAAIGGGASKVSVIGAMVFMWLAGMSVKTKKENDDA